MPLKLLLVALFLAWYQLPWSADTDNPGYFPPILGLFWAILDYLKLNPGYLPSIYRHINMDCQCPVVSDGLVQVDPGPVLVLGLVEPVSGALEVADVAGAPKVAS